MNLKLKTLFAKDARVDVEDVRTLQIMLNHLGFYQPPENIGITEIPNADIATAIEWFQREHDLIPDGRVRPGDATEGAINDAYERLSQEKRKYIWKTVGDSRVRASHAALDGELRTFGDGLAPGEEPGCRCSAVAVKKGKCAEERQKYEEAKQKVKELTDKFHDLLIQMNILRQRMEYLNSKARENLGVRIVTFVINLPSKRIGILGELLQRYFEGVISNHLIEAAENFMQQFWALKERYNKVAKQGGIVYSELLKASQELDYAIRKLEACEKSE